MSGIDQMPACRDRYGNLLPEYHSKKWQRGPLTIKVYYWTAWSPKVSINEKRWGWRWSITWHQECGENLYATKTEASWAAVEAAIKPLESALRALKKMVRKRK